MCVIYLTVSPASYFSVLFLLPELVIDQEIRAVGLSFVDFWAFLTPCFDPNSKKCSDWSFSWMEINLGHERPSEQQKKMKNLIQETLLKIFQLYFSPGWFSTRFLKLIPGVWSGIHRDSFSGAQEKPPKFVSRRWGRLCQVLKELCLGGVFFKSNLWAG